MINSFKILSILLSILGVTFINCLAQDTVVSHAFYSTASSPKLVDWKIASDSLAICQIRETIDEKGRVVELRFMCGSELAKFTCFEPSIIKFEYVENKIIELRYHDENVQMNYVECGMAYKTIYTVQDGSLVNCVDFYDYEPYLTTLAHEFGAEELAELKQKAQENKEGVLRPCDIIPGFVYSSAKFGGVNIVAEDFDPSNYHFPYGKIAEKSKYAFINSLKNNIKE